MLFWATLFSLYCLRLPAQQWNQVPGIEAQDIGIGKGGVLWATGKNGAIYRWNGALWVQMPGGALRVAVDPEGAAWVVNSGNQIYKYNNTSWQWDLIPGGAKDVGVGADGSVWVIGANPVPGGFDIYRRSGTDWVKVPGGAVRIAVDPNGNAWVINNSNTIFSYNGTDFMVRPGAAVDIGIGADGSVWCAGTDGKIYKWNGSNWDLKTGLASQIAVAPDGNIWAVNSSNQVWRMGPAMTIQVRRLFPREQTWEYKVLKALRYGTYGNTINLGNQEPTYASLDPLSKAFGQLALTAAELYFAGNSIITADQALAQVGSYNNKNTREGVAGILAFLVIYEATKNSTDPQVTVIKDWATQLFRSMKIRAAKSVLDEYERWKADPCTYTAEGYKAPPDCALKGLNFTQWYGSHKPPQDVIAKAGLKSVLSSQADEVANGVTIGIAAASTGVAFAVLTSVLGTTTAAGVTTGVSLAAAFGGTVSSQTVVISGALGAGWAGVAAAPIAAAVMAIVVGTIRGIEEVEAAKVGPTLKMKLGAAMTEHINIINALSTTEGKDMFLVGFREAAARNYVVPPTRVNGEVRFYCQAGYVSRFQLSYTLNGENKSITTRDLPVGHEESIEIPYNATNIRVQGSYLAGTWKPIFNETLAAPTFICYTSYGTIFDARHKTDCPEVSNLVANRNEITLINGGGYVAQFHVDYTLNGSNVHYDSGEVGAGWNTKRNIPEGATNIRIKAWSKTGLVWEPWKTILERSYPSPPNECIKVYNTTLDPKWNNECK